MCCYTDDPVGVTFPSSSCVATSQSHVGDRMNDPRQSRRAPCPAEGSGGRPEPAISGHGGAETPWAERTGGAKVDAQFCVIVRAGSVCGHGQRNRYREFSHESDSSRCSHPWF